MKMPFFKHFDPFKHTTNDAEPGQHLPFDKLSHTTRIVVSTKLNRQFLTIHDPEVIKRVVSFIQTHRGGWTVPDQGVPVMPVRLSFFAGEVGLGSFGVGHKTFTAYPHQLDGFFTKCPTPEDRDRLVELIGLKDHFPD